MNERQRKAMATTIEQIAVLSDSGQSVGDLLRPLAMIIRGTHEASPTGLKEVTKDE